MNNRYFNDWDGDSKSDNSNNSVFFEEGKMLFYLYGDINTVNCADIANNILKINMDDDIICFPISKKWLEI